MKHAPDINVEEIVAKVTSEDTSDEEILEILEDLTRAVPQMYAAKVDLKEIDEYLHKLHMICKGLRHHAQKQHMMKYTYFGMFDVSMQSFASMLNTGKKG